LEKKDGDRIEDKH